MVTEERTMQVPRVVEKRTPVVYTERVPRTVVYRVPIDSCGNPIPNVSASTLSSSSPSVAPAVSSVAKPASSETKSLPSNQPTATFGESSSIAPKGSTTTEGWQQSARKHIDPDSSDESSRVRVQKPSPIAVPPIETIPTPAPALGPAVEPAAPATEPEPVTIENTSVVPGIDSTARPDLAT
jgi:hypothetical protein